MAINNGLYVSALTVIADAPDPAHRSAMVRLLAQELVHRLNNSTRDTRPRGGGAPFRGRDHMAHVYLHSGSQGGEKVARQFGIYGPPHKPGQALTYPMISVPREPAGDVLFSEGPIVDIIVAAVTDMGEDWTATREVWRDFMANLYQDQFYV